MVGFFGPAPKPEKAWIGWAAIAFFGLGAVIFVRRLSDDDVQLRISSEGIHYKPWSAAMIGWIEISVVGVWSYRGQRSIMLSLHHPDRFPSTTILGRVAKGNRMMTGGDIPISMTALDQSFADAMDAITKFRGEADVDQARNLAKSVTVE